MSRSIIVKDLGFALTQSLSPHIDIIITRAMGILRIIDRKFQFSILFSNIIQHIRSLVEYDFIIIWSLK